MNAERNVSKMQCILYTTNNVYLITYLLLLYQV